MELNKDIRFSGITCELCGSESFYELERQKTMWCCNGKTWKNEPCIGMVCKCNKCDKVYVASHFGKHGDVWECKTCGAVQWEYTGLMRFHEMLQQRSAKARSLTSEIENDLRQY